MSIYIWGEGQSGRLELGDARNCYEPTLLNTITDDKLEWIQIDCGRYHTVGLTKKGEVFTWGSNYYGQLGHGDRNVRPIPTKVESLDGLFIIQISCGDSHTAAITDKGEIFTWGNGYGLLGHHNKELQLLTPKKIKALGEELIVQVACGTYHTCAVTSAGSIFTWGEGLKSGHGEGIILKPKLLQDLSSKGVIYVSASYHTACVTTAGEVFTWGRGYSGELGHGHQTRHQDTPKRVEALVGEKGKTVSCGECHTAVCTEDGKMYTLGQGANGKLGHGDKGNKTTPTLVQALEGKHITQVQCGKHYTMALTSSGYVFTWGNAMDGCLGHGSKSGLKCFSSIPCLVEGLRDHNVVQITGGYDHCAVLVDPSPFIIRNSQQAAFNNPELSDVVLMVENEPLYANVNDLSQKSDYFAAMFRSNMRESIERVVKVTNCSKASFLKVLEYLCLDDYIVSIDDAVELWELADFYQLEGLKYSCMGSLEKGLDEDNVSRILGEAEDLSCTCDSLKRMCHEFLEQDDDDSIYGYDY